MLGFRSEVGKYCVPQFADPVWTEKSTEWQKLDVELPPTHPARMIVAALEMLDLEPLFDSYAAGGSDSTRPDLMLRIVLIEHWSGRRHPSQWFKDALENSPLKWAGFGICPSRAAWYRFRDRLNDLLEPWFQEVLEKAQAEGLTPARRGALDGSFVGANASRRHLLNEDRLDKHQEELASICEQDQQGASPEEVPPWMAKTPWTRTQQAERLGRAKTRLEGFLEANQRRSPSERRPRYKIVVSATDPEAALGLDKEKVFRPLYNVQLVRDLDSPLILGYDVFAQNSDGGTLAPMLERERDRFGLSLSALVCDATYVTGCNLAICEKRQAVLYGPWRENDYSGKSKKKKPQMIPKEDFTWVPELHQYRCPEGHLLPWIGKEKRTQADGETNVMHRFRCSPEDCRACRRQESCTTNPARGRAVKRSEHEELIDAHRSHMETSEAKEVYRLRKQTVELAYADLKHNRGLRTFSGRGLVRARIEVGLTELVYNLMVVEREIKNRGTFAQPLESICQDC